MEDKDKTKEELIKELMEMRETVAALETSGTRLKKAEETLRKSEQKYHTLFEESKDALYITAPDGRFVNVNKEMLNLFGYTKEEMLGMNAREIYVHAFDRYRFQQELEQKGFVRGYEEKFRKKDGTEIDCLLTSIMHRADGERILEYQGIIRDITEIKRAEEKINKLNAELNQKVTALEAANKELETFIYSVSHDLRNHLLVIGNIGNILADKHSLHLDVSEPDYFNIIRAKAQTMLQLMDEVLAFSHLERQQVKPSAIDMEALAKIVFEDLRTLVPNRTVKLEIKMIPPAYGDKGLIRQVLVNLLSNALKFTQPKETGVIEIGGRAEGNENVYYVKDNGIGFDMKYANKLFDAFRRLPSAEEFEGTGVGLAIVQRIINRHGGQVWAEGRVNEGATFHFTLPKEEVRRQPKLPQC